MCNEADEIIACQKATELMNDQAVNAEKVYMQNCEEQHRIESMANKCSNPNCASREECLAKGTCENPCC